MHIPIIVAETGETGKSLSFLFLSIMHCLRVWCNEEISFTAISQSVWTYIGNQQHEWMNECKSLCHKSLYPAETVGAFPLSRPVLCLFREAGGGQVRGGRTLQPQ